MTSKTTTYMVKGSKRERFKTDNLAKIPGVEVSTKETRDIVEGRAKRGTTKQMPYVDPGSADTGRNAGYTPPAPRHNDLESQRPTLGVGIDAPCADPPARGGFVTDEYASPDCSGPGSPLGFESSDEPTLAPEGAEFQPPWASPTPVPTPRRSTARIPAQPRPQPHRPPEGSGAIPFAMPQVSSSPSLPSRTSRPTARQIFLVVSFQAGTEPVTLPGVKTPAHLPVVRIESTFSTYDAAFAKAARLNREHAAQGRVYAVNAVNIPM